MRNIESYKPEIKVARELPRGFRRPKKSSGKHLHIKDDPKVVIRAIYYTVSTIALVGLVVFSAYKIIRWQAESDVTNQTIAKLQSETEVKTISKTPTVSEIKTPENQRYLDMDLIDVDLSPLRQTNPNAIGWINVPGTSINYPYVQAADNDFYLYHTFDGHWSDAGWVFLDYRNNKSLTDKNQIIYAHGRIDGSMFGSLQNVLDESWFNNEDNRVVKISNDETSTLWQVFSVYRIPKTNDYITTNFSDPSEFKGFIKMIQDRSLFNFKTPVEDTDRILTLSTCIGTNDRAVLHAKLIKLIEK